MSGRPRVFRRVAVLEEDYEALAQIQGQLAMDKKQHVTFGDAVHWLIEKHRVETPLPPEYSVKKVR